jgi:hypothetical protein
MNPHQQYKRPTPEPLGECEYRGFTLTESRGGTWTAASDEAGILIDDAETQRYARAIVDSYWERKEENESE